MASVLGLDIKSVSNILMKTNYAIKFKKNIFLERTSVCPSLLCYDDDELLLQLSVQCFSQNELGAAYLQQKIVQLNR